MIARILGFVAVAAVTALVILGCQRYENKAGEAPTTRPAPAAAQPAATVWHSSLGEAFGQARREDKLVLVDFWRPNCGYCDMLDAQVLTQAEFLDAVKGRFVLASINVWDDANADSVAPYRREIPGTPTLMILKSNGDVVSASPGFTPLDQTVQWVKSSGS